MNPELTTIGRTYQTDILPASGRGAVVGSIQLFIQFGQPDHGFCDKQNLLDRNGSERVHVAAFFVALETTDSMAPLDM